jgi:hypothetical protein
VMGFFQSTIKRCFCSIIMLGGTKRAVLYSHTS